MIKLFLAVFLVSLVQSRTFQKRQDTCDPAIDLTRVPDNCSQFYRCSNGFYSVGTCPGSYQFDEAAKRCKPASQVNCTPKGSECTDEDDLVAIDCIQFKRCLNGYSSTESCPEGFVFDSTNKICNYPDEVPGCESGNTETTKSGGDCTSADDLTQNPDNCQQFFRCANGQRSTFDCPSGTKFDSNLKVCNWADQVTCTSSGSSGSDDSSGSPTSSGSCTSSDDLTQVPGNCGKFYRCANGQRSTFDCPAGTKFDNNLKICNWPDQVTCV